MNPEPDLSVVIPVHNASQSIAALVEEFVGVPDLGVQVILVDDGSTDGSDEILRRLDADHPDVHALFHPVNSGAGIARNTGFAEATGRFTLFFDADDIVHTDALGIAVTGLDESGADVAMMPYRYRRGRHFQHEAMNTHDLDIWDRCLGDSGTRIVTLDDASYLLGFSAYPWNKIIRTARFRDVGLAFGHTPVHNDVLGHWYSLLFAREILLLNHEICTHIVEEGGRNLSNRDNETRLTLFDALDETYDFLVNQPHLRNRYSHHYWSFVIRTAGWAISLISPEYRDEFNVRLQEHLLRMNIADFARLRLKRSSPLADSIIRKTLA